MLGTSGLTGAFKHLVIGDPITKQKDLLKVLVISKIKAVYAGQFIEGRVDKVRGY